MSKEPGPVQTVQRVLEQVIGAHPLALKEPAPVIRVGALGPSSVDFIVRPWSRTVDYWTVYWDLTRQVKQAFDANGVSIPYPQQDLHIRHVPAAEKAAGGGEAAAATRPTVERRPDDAAAAIARGEG